MAARLLAPRQAVIWAGGRGERLRPLTEAVPKPMVPVNGTPFLDYLLQSLADVGVEKVLLLVGYLADRIVSRYGVPGRGPVSVGFSMGGEDDLTGRRLLNAYDQLDDRFLLLYGDNYWPVEMDGLLAAFGRPGARICVTVYGNRDGKGEYGGENNILVDDAGMVRLYDGLRQAPGLNGVNMGYCVVDKSALDPATEGNISFEDGILSSLIARSAVSGYVTHQPYHYITDEASLRRFENFVLERGVLATRWDGSTADAR